MPRGTVLAGDKILYAESVAAGWLLKSLIAVAFFSGLAFVALAVTSDPKLTLFYTVMFLFTVLFPSLLYVSFRVLNITITGSQIDVKYGLGTRTIIPISEVVGCAKIKSGFSGYGGAGVRLGADGSWAYILYFGDAVRVTRKEGRAIVFST